MLCLPGYAPGMGLVRPPRGRGTVFFQLMCKAPKHNIFSQMYDACWTVVGHFSICTFSKSTSFGLTQCFIPDLHQKPVLSFFVDFPHGFFKVIRMEKFLNLLFFCIHQPASSSCCPPQSSLGTVILQELRKLAQFSTVSLSPQLNSSPEGEMS